MRSLAADSIDEATRGLDKETKSILYILSLSLGVHSHDLVIPDVTLAYPDAPTRERCML